MAVAEDTLRTGLSLAARDDAFRALVDARRDDAVRLAFRLLRGDTAAAEDVAQNAFVRAFRALPGFRAEASIDTWFYRILVREVHRYRRWQALRQVWSGDASEVPEPADERPVGDPGLRQRITAALEHLSGPQREAFVLVHLEGFTLTESAAIMGKATGTVKSHLHRALASLRNDLADLRSSEAKGHDPAGDAHER